jgi:hypothetical protein
MEVVEMKKTARLNHSKTSREGIPRELALEKCVKTFSIKLQPSLFRMVKKHTPRQIRKALLEAFKGEKA